MFLNVNKQTGAGGGTETTHVLYPPCGAGGTARRAQRRIHGDHLLARARTGHGSLSKKLFGGEDFPGIFSKDRPAGAAFVY